MSKDINITHRGEDGVATFGFQKLSLAIEGIEKLLQIFVKELLTTPGSDYVIPESGGGLQSYLGYNISDEQEVRSSLMIDIDRTLDQIIESQATQSLPATERISTAQMTDLDITDDGELFLTILVAAQSGEYAITTLPVRK